MQTHYTGLIKSGATSLGNDSMSKSIFTMLDKDYNGTLSQNEIDEAQPSLGNILKEAAMNAKNFAMKMFGGNTGAAASSEKADNTIVENNSVPNGKIDNDFQQGNTGDCWLLAALAAKASTPEGLSDINGSLEIDENGNIKVYIEKNCYTFTKEELEAHPELASGDLDVRAIELAMNKHAQEPIDNGGHPAEMFGYLSFGKDGGEANYYSMETKGDQAIDILRNNNNPDSLGKTAMVAGTYDYKDLSDIKVTDENGNDVQLYNNHAYAAIKADEEYVYLKNPHDTSHTLKISIEDFKSAFYGFGTQAMSSQSLYLKSGIPSNMQQETLPVPE